MRREKGAILIMVLLALVTLTILGGAFVQLGMYDQRFSERSQAGVQAFYQSESAIDRGLTWLRSQLVPPQGIQPMVLFGGWRNLGQGSYMAIVDPDDNNATSEIKRYTIEGWGIVGPQAAPTVLRKNKMVVQTESFAMYAYFTNSERSWPNGLQVYFMTGDRIEGPTHTNGQFAMFGKPIFEGPVSSVANSVDYWGGSQVTKPVFKEPPKLGVPEKRFPASLPESLTSAAESGGTVLKGDTAISLLPDGTMEVTNRSEQMVSQVMPLPKNGVLFVDGGNLTVQGTLNGQLTLGASKDIRVVDSVTYLDDPTLNPKSDDILGLVAGGNVVIPPEAPPNLRIDAAIMAINRSLVVERWMEKPPRGKLTINGGIIERNRGIMGTFNPGNGKKLTGYTRDYHYDKRLAAMSPPFFPTTGDYKILVWHEEKK